MQWNLDLTKSLGTDQIRSLNRGFVMPRFFFIYFAITRAKNTVRYIEVFVKSQKLATVFDFSRNNVARKIDVAICPV